MCVETERACDIKECEFHRNFIPSDMESFSVPKLNGEFIEVERITRLRFAKNGVIYNVCSLHTALSDEEIMRLLP
ncbi:hypothetical protein JCM14124_07210 [Humidesulfovibrio idahonensis]